MYSSFISSYEDGLNWTALNGFHPLFEVGTDYADDIETVGITTQ